MYSVDSLEYAVRHLFQGGIGEHGYSEEEDKKAVFPSWEPQKATKPIRQSRSQVEKTARVF